MGEKNVVCRVSDDEIRSHPHSHTDTDKAHGDCGLGGYGVWGDGSEGAIHNPGKARQGSRREKAQCQCQSWM